MIDSPDLVNTSVKPPMIDRSLKAKALIKSSQISQNEVLEAEKDIIEDSLEQENEELKMEEEWEKLRLKRENAASEELRMQVIETVYYELSAGFAHMRAHPREFLI